MKLGMLDPAGAVPYDDIPYTAVDSPAMQKLNPEAAKKTLVLLKNQGGLLPLDKSKLKTVAVIGPNANNRRALVGNYEGTASRYITVLEGEEGDEGNEFASGDRESIDLPGLQEEILKTICASGKPVVLVLQSGSALAVNWAAEHVPAILQCWYPGAQGGRAVAETIFGACSPGG